MKIGILGNGMVGSATATVLREYGFDVRCFDTMPERSTHAREDALECDWVLLCVQTTGKWKAAMETFQKAVDGVDPSKLVVRSTMLPSMYRKLNKGAPTIWPEFLTARTAVEDMRNPKRIILGGSGATQFDADVTLRVWPGVPKFVFPDGENACKVKLVCNVFGAMKVMFWNIVHEWAGDESYGDVLEACLANGWINPQHTQVPGPDGLPGFGGVCFPKDMELFQAEMEELRWEDESELFLKVLAINKRMRSSAE